MCSESGSKLFVLSGRKPAGGCKQAGGPDICILRLFQRVVINHDRNDGSARFRIAGTPMPVARAAPRIPSFGKNPELKNPHVVLVYSP